jgi:hypothetical protein
LNLELDSECLENEPGSLSFGGSGCSVTSCSKLLELYGVLFPALVNFPAWLAAFLVVGWWEALVEELERGPGL